MADDRNPQLNESKKSTDPLHCTIVHMVRKYIFPPDVMDYCFTHAERLSWIFFNSRGKLKKMVEFWEYKKLSPKLYGSAIMFKKEKPSYAIIAIREYHNVQNSDLKFLESNSFSWFQNLFVPKSVILFLY